MMMTDLFDEKVLDLVLVRRVKAVLLGRLAHVNVAEHERSDAPQRDRLDVKLLPLDPQDGDLSIDRARRGGNGHR